MFGKKEILQPLIIDISENRILAVDYMVDHKIGNTVIQGIGEVKLPFGVVNTNFVEKEDILVQAIDAAISQARHINAKNNPTNSVVFGVSGPLVEVRNRVVEIQREKPQQKISSKEWISTINDVYTQFEAEGYSSHQGHSLPMSLVQISLNNIILDNQAVFSPIGDKGEHIQLETINTYIPAQYKSSMLNISKALNLEIDGVYQHGYGVGQLILDYHPNKDVEAVLIDIRFGHTTISIIKEQKIIYIQSFSMGSHSFTQAIANTFQITLDEAETVRQEYSRLQLPRDMSRRITDALESEISLWLQGIIVSLQSLNVGAIPQNIVLYGEGAQLLGIKEVLEYSMWYKSLDMPTQPMISILTPKQFQHIVDMTSLVDSPRYMDILGLIHTSSIPIDIHPPYLINE